MCTPVAGGRYADYYFVGFSALSKYGIHLSLLGLVACEQVTAISLAAS